MTNTHDQNSPVSLQVSDMLSNPLVKETAEALKAQGITPLSQADLEYEEDLNGLAQQGGLDPVTAALGLIAHSEANEDKTADNTGLPKEVAEARQLITSLQNLDPFEMLHPLLENGKPWAVKLALGVFEQGAIMAAFGASSGGEDRVNQEIGDAALTVMDGLAAKDRWKGVPEQMLSKFIGAMENMTQQDIGSKAISRALKTSFAQLKEAVEGGSSPAAAPQRPATRRPPAATFGM